MHAYTWCVLNDLTCVLNDLSAERPVLNDLCAECAECAERAECAECAECLTTCVLHDLTCRSAIHRTRRPWRVPLCCVFEIERILCCVLCVLR